MMKLFRKEVICFTGKSRFTRVIMERYAVENGAKIVKRVTEQTTLVVMGQRPGSKLEVAYKKGIKLMIDDEFLSLINK